MWCRGLAQCGGCAQALVPGWHESVEAAPFDWSTACLLLWATVKDLWDAWDYEWGPLLQGQRNT